MYPTKKMFFFNKKKKRNPMKNTMAYVSNELYQKTPDWYYPNHFGEFRSLGGVPKATVEGVPSFFYPPVFTARTSNT